MSDWKEAAIAAYESDKEAKLQRLQSIRIKQASQFRENLSQLLQTEIPEDAISIPGAEKTGWPEAEMGEVTFVCESGVEHIDIRYSCLQCGQVIVERVANLTSIGRILSGDTEHKCHTATLDETSELTPEQQLINALKAVLS
ncbi:hypothetical protein CCAX7_37330 [Capsulimonas corticalis]|uniref:Uncharacterized protein n=1 Tax=Capsulimonas corticalis TaxID=2219043 RepID=A0A402D186_9BACT|nr:hypothetical protein [Capsulimonas corticalis]BDI31682.1 hypothetical protein CCAX7_37330 [Capsulimonas corticalis]